MTTPIETAAALIAPLLGDAGFGLSHAGLGLAGLVGLVVMAAILFADEAPAEAAPAPAPVPAR
jgi:hypothetical protein